METKLPIAVAIGLIVQLGGIVWWASSLHSEVQHNDYQIQMMQKDVAHNSRFVLEWPAGEWLSGELPSDTRQDLKIEALEKQVEKLTKRIFEINGHAR
jgi:hypothetical protein